MRNLPDHIAQLERDKLSELEAIREKIKRVRELNREIKRLKRIGKIDLVSNH